MADQEEQQSQQNSIEQLIAEKNDLEHTHPLAAKLLENEITRIQSGAVENLTFIELHRPKTKVEFRVRIPQKEFPQVNFVGKILGQGGETVRQLQEATNVRIAVLGHGSMKDKAKQEELRKQGGKYAHLNHDLHVWFEAIGHPIDCYQRIVHAFQLVHPYLTPDPNETGEGQANGAVAARGMVHGGAMPRGGMRGAVPPRGAMATARGAMGPMTRGVSAARGGVSAARGAMMAGSLMATGAVRPPMRGGLAARGGRGAPMAASGRGVSRGAGPASRGAASRGVAPVRGAAAGRGRGMPAAVTAPSMMQAQAAYPTESYSYEAQAVSMYGGGYGEDMNTGYEDPMAMADSGYLGVTAADSSDAYQYEAYGQVNASGGYAGYGDIGWAGDGTDGSGYGKVATPTRGALNAYRTRPY